MGKQNDAFTAYLGRAEVLADLYNGCLYQGEKVVQATCVRYSSFINKDCQSA